MPRRPTAAFFSYSHADDKCDEGRLTWLRERLAEEVRVQTGSPFEIFQDLHSLRWGDQWQDRIKAAIQQADLLIAIVTPSFLTSEYCRIEVQEFLDKEAAAGKTLPLLPILYIDALDGEADPIAEAMSARQYLDFRALRLLPASDLAWKTALRDAAAQVRALIQGGPPPVTTAQPVPHAAAKQKGWLPTPVTRFVGRGSVVKSVCGLLKQHRLVNILGVGGCGKTRVAIEVGAKLRSQFKDGVQFIDLVSSLTCDHLAQAIAKALEISEEKGQTVLESVCKELGQREMLLILDNCEQLDSDAASVVDTLLQSCPRLRILVTSRKTLSRLECEYRLEPMAVPDESHPSRETILKYESVQLFLDCASQKGIPIKLTEPTARVIAKVCNRLEGIPLCIELVVPLLNAYVVEELPGKLEQALLARPEGGSARPERRQETISATIACSFDLLSDVEKQVWTAMSVFMGGWTIDTLATVCGGISAEIDPLRVWTSLYNRSMVSLRRGSDGKLRQFELEPMRHFAQRVLEKSGGTDEAYERLTAWSLETSKALDARYQASRDMAVMDEFALEYANLRAAIEHCVGRPELAWEALLLSLQVHRYWMRRGQLSEGAGFLEAAIKQAPRKDLQTVCRAMNVLGVFFWYQGRLEDASKQMQECLSLLDKETPEGLKLASAVANNLAILATEQGDLARSAELLRECVDLFEKTGDAKGQADSLANLGYIEKELGNRQAALDTLQRAHDMHRGLGDRWGQAMTLGNIAGVHLAAGQTGSATPLIKECIALALELKENSLTLSTLVDAAYLLHLLEKLEDAASALAAATALNQSWSLTLLPAHRKMCAEVGASPQSSSKGIEWTSESALQYCLDAVHSAGSAADALPA